MRRRVSRKNSELTDRAFMARALQLAERGVFSTAPNPNVGCVIVNRQQVVGCGWHRRSGGPHAEIFALEEAGAQARGADAFVTLEPCSHQGRTPPCADALIEAGVRRMVVAMQDPDPRVSGQGIARLRDAGIEVVVGVLEESARQLNPGFIARCERGRPWVRLKLAASLDGRTAMADGDSHWITGEPARRDVQYWRARSDAIVTGVGTVIADDPSLNVRLTAGELHGVEPVRQPLRVIMDSALRTPPGARLLRLPGTVLVATAANDETRANTLREAGAEVAVVTADRDGRVDPHATMRILGERGCNEVLLECGPTLAGRFLREGLVDEAIVYLAPHIMGDAARGMFVLPGLERMQDRVRLQWLDARRVGTDMRLRLQPQIGAGGA